VRLLSTVAIIVCILFAASTAQAQWTGKAELGFLNSSGNAESTSANTKFDLKRDSEKWINTFYVGALYGNNGEFTNAQRYEARYQLDYKINDKLSWFGALRGGRSLQRVRLPGDRLHGRRLQVHR
jgi:putative salt-induced outer membrane protein